MLNFIQFQRHLPETVNVKVLENSGHTPYCDNCDGLSEIVLKNFHMNKFIDLSKEDRIALEVLHEEHLKEDLLNSESKGEASFVEQVLLSKFSSELSRWWLPK